MIEVSARALELFEMVKQENDSKEITLWLEQTAQHCLAHMTYLDAFEEEDMSAEDVALLTIMEPYLFLLGVVISNHWLERLDEKEH